MYKDSKNIQASTFKLIKLDFIKEMKTNDAEVA